VARTLKIAPTDAPAPVLNTADDVHDVSPAPSPMRAGASVENRLGNILVELGRIEGRHVEAVLAQQAQNPRRFGDLAIALGLVVRADIDLALARQFDVDFVPAAEPDEGALALPDRLGDAQGEVLRAVRSQLVLRWFGNEPEQRTLAVVSHGAGEGRSHVCAHLAMQLAQMDEDTLVIDADLRKPSLHSFFGVENKTGLTDYLARDVVRAPIRAVPGKPRLHLLSAGNFRPDAQALLERRQFALLLGTLAQRYAFILIDTPPAAQFSEALTVAVRASGCLLVTRRNRTRMADAQHLADQLTRHSVEVLGAVINER
jgi:chain length determinant protein tyrosine kinase EpsG